jgi:hypothetical protein
MEDQYKIKASIIGPDGLLDLDKLAHMLYKIQEELKKLNEGLKKG